VRTNHGRDIGTHDFAGHLFHWDGPPLRWKPISALGEDNEAVYRTLLGVDDATWTALVEEGHISEIYRGPDGQPL
jgi:hypothetical protein